MLARDIQRPSGSMHCRALKLHHGWSRWISMNLWFWFPWCIDGRAQSKRFRKDQCGADGADTYQSLAVDTSLIGAELLILQGFVAPVTVNSFNTISSLATSDTRTSNEWVHHSQPLSKVKRVAPLGTQRKTTNGDLHGRYFCSKVSCRGWTWLN